MNYYGVAHDLKANPQQYALYRHGKGFAALTPEQQKAAEEHAGDHHRHPTLHNIDPSGPKDEVERALNAVWADALALCAENGIEIGYAMIKREDGMKYTSVAEAQWAIENGR